MTLCVPCTLLNLYCYICKIISANLNNDESNPEFLALYRHLRLNRYEDVVAIATHHRTLINIPCLAQRDSVFIL